VPSGRPAGIWTGCVGCPSELQNPLVTARRVADIGATTFLLALELMQRASHVHDGFWQLEGTPNEPVHTPSRLPDGLFVALSLASPGALGEFHHFQSCGLVHDEGNVGASITEYFSGPPRWPDGKPISSQHSQLNHRISNYAMIRNGERPLSH